MRRTIETLLTPEAAATFTPESRLKGFEGVVPGCVSLVSDAECRGTRAYLPTATRSPHSSAIRAMRFVRDFSGRDLRRLALERTRDVFSFPGWRRNDRGSHSTGSPCRCHICGLNVERRKCDSGSSVPSRRSCACQRQRGIRRAVLLANAVGTNAKRHCGCVPVYRHQTSARRSDSPAPAKAIQTPRADG